MTTKVTDDYLLANSISVVCEPMAYDLKGVSIHHGAWYQIRINTDIPEDQKWRALLHELYHIANNDFVHLGSVTEMEAENPY